MKNIKNKKILVFGAGGHARVICDVFESNGFSVTALFDDKIHLKGKKSGVWKINGNLVDMIQEIKTNSGLEFFIAVGDNFLRKSISQRIVEETKKKPLNCISSFSVVSSHTSMKSGIFIAPGVVINYGVKIGDGVIVNTAATVDHDCDLGDYSAVQPGVHLGGGVKIGKKALIGIGASVKQYLKVGDEAVVGGGAMVIKDVDPEKTVVGVPAE